VRVEVVASEPVAKAIVEAVINKFFTNYAGFAYLQDVEVVRAAKFGL
jgi:hypothetical protein